MADTAPTMDDVFESSGLKLVAHVAEPTLTGVTMGQPVGVILCHGFPVRGREAPASGKSFLNWPTGSPPRWAGWRWR